MTSFLDVRLISAEGEQTARVPVSRLIVAGWTGRDRAAVEKHIRELEQLGVKRPSSTPVYYRVAASRVTTAPTVQVSGSASSGEVEFVLAQWNGELWVGLGSDHTDRQAEAYDVTVSKQMCEKPVAPVFWRFRDVEAHWDDIAMRAFIHEKGERTLYQSGNVSGMIAPRDLIAGFDARGLPEGVLMFCGTFAAIGGIRPAPRFEGELEDPRTGRRITLAYDIEELPVVS
jgi:biotin operon repressor